MDPKLEEPEVFFQESEEGIESDEGGIRLEDFDEIRVFSERPVVSLSFVKSSDGGRYFIYDFNTDSLMIEKPVEGFSIRKGRLFPELREKFSDYKGDFAQAHLLLIRYDR